MPPISDRLAAGPWQRATLVGIILLAFWLRVHQLDAQSLWLDEITSAYRTTLPLGEAVLNVADNLQAPAYFVALTGWVSAAGRSEFSLRFFSVWTGLLFVPLLYYAGQHIFRSRRLALLAALLGAISPAHIIYSQEARTYAILPLLYLALLAVALGRRDLSAGRLWLFVSLCEILGLYLHLFFGFAVVAFNVLVLFRLRSSGGRAQRRWIASQLVTAVALSLWLLVVWRWGGAVPGNLLGTAAAAPLPVSRYLHLTWDFFHIGLVNTGLPPTAPAHLLALVAALCVGLALVRGQFRGQAALLAAALALPWAAAYAAWRVNPLSHPRYLLFLLAPILLLLAYGLSLAVRPRLQAALIVTGVALFAANSALALRLGRDPAFARLDMRALAQAIGERAQAGDVVLMPPLDHSLWYYSPAPARVVNWSPLPGSLADQAAALNELLAAPGNVFFVRYQELYSPDPRDQIPFFLELSGRLVQRFSVHMMDVDLYTLEKDRPSPRWQPAAHRCGPLVLRGVYYQPVVPAGNAAVTALRWELALPTADAYRVSVRLWDEADPLASADVTLLDARGGPTSGWAAGQEVVNYYSLPIPLGRPPLTYALRARVYNGQGEVATCDGAADAWLALGQVQLEPGVNQQTDPYGSWAGVTWQPPAAPEVAPGLRLEGYTYRPRSWRPGETAYVTLRWRALRDGLPHYEPRLLLADGQALLAAAAGSLFQRYGTEQWRQGELLIETRALPVPATLAPLQLSLETAGQTALVAEVGVDGQALRWEAPDTAAAACADVGGVARLIGFEWAPDPGQPDRWWLTLYWQAAAAAPAEVSFTVFTHLLDDAGALIAQHDGLPDADRRPTTTWLPGEVIADRHPIIVPAGYAGSGALLAGMYAPGSGQRLPALDCAGAPLADDAVLLRRGALLPPSGE